MNHILKKMAFHRNGVCGEGFHVAIVESDGEDMLCITFDSEPKAIRTAVFELEKLKTGVIEFQQNSWRGDHWHDFMIEEINKANQ